MMNLNPGVEEYVSAHLECGDISPTFSYVEDNRASRVFTQFTWGCKYETAFRHSSDQNTRVICTLGKLAK